MSQIFIDKLNKYQIVFVNILKYVFNSTEDSSVLIEIGSHEFYVAYDND